MDGVGWSFFPSNYPSCFIPSYNGTKMVYIATDAFESTVYILNMANMTWRNASATLGFYYVACAASGDQLIVWGSGGYRANSTSEENLPSNVTLVFNMKTETWVSNYTAPTITDHGDTFSDDRGFSKLIIIIIIIVGVLLTIILTTISLYLGLTKRMGINQSASSDDSIASDVDIDCRPSLVSAGIRPPLEHPHAILNDPTGNRNVQEDAVEVQLTLGNPHTVVEDEISA
jgi:hypothetical protein